MAEKMIGFCDRLQFFGKNANGGGSVDVKILCADAIAEVVQASVISVAEPSVVNIPKFVVLSLTDTTLLPGFCSNSP